MQRTNIEWVVNPDGSRPGWSWSPITGCLNGCPYCYARKLADGRLKEKYLGGNAGFANPKAYLEGKNVPFYPRFWADRLWQPQQGKGKGIFCCDMSDLFGIGVPTEWASQVLEVIDFCRWHRFYLLTKQPQNLAKFSPFPENCWIGVSATNDYQQIEALAWLQRIEAKVKYISFEPLLGEITLPVSGLGGINWLIIGAQTKPIVYPKLEWVQEIVKAADRANIKIFLKDNLKPLFQPLMRVPNLSWFGNVFGLRQEMPK